VILAKEMQIHCSVYECIRVSNR